MYRVLIEPILPLKLDGYHRQWRRGFELLIRNPHSNMFGIKRVGHYAIKTLATQKDLGFFSLTIRLARIRIIYIHIIIYIYHRIYVLKNTPTIGRIGRTGPIKLVVFFFKSLDISGSEFGKARSWMRIAKLWTSQQRRWKWPWGHGDSGGQHHHVTWVEAALEGNSPDGAGPSHSLDQRYQGGLICIKLFLYNHNYILLYIYICIHISIYNIFTVSLFSHI